MVVNSFPVLLLEVSSDSSETDKNCMLLQASCLVHLGNALMKEPKFLIKAIYIADNYNATEYMVFQSPDPV